MEGDGLKIHGQENLFVSVGVLTIDIGGEQITMEQ